MSSDKVIAHVQPSCEFLSNYSKGIRSLHRHKKKIFIILLLKQISSFPNGERGETSIETVGILLQFSIWKVLIVNKKMVTTDLRFQLWQKNKDSFAKGELLGKE